MTDTAQVLWRDDFSADHFSNNDYTAAGDADLASAQLSVAGELRWFDERPRVPFNWTRIKVWATLAQADDLVYPGQPETVAISRIAGGSLPPETTFTYAFTVVDGGNETQLSGEMVNFTLSDGDFTMVLTGLQGAMDLATGNSPTAQWRVYKMLDESAQEWELVGTGTGNVFTDDGTNSGPTFPPPTGPLQIMSVDVGMRAKSGGISASIVSIHPRHPVNVGEGVDGSVGLAGRVFGGPLLRAINGSYTGQPDPPIADRGVVNAGEVSIVITPDGKVVVSSPDGSDLSFNVPAADLTRWLTDPLFPFVNIVGGPTPTILSDWGYEFDVDDTGYIQPGTMKGGAVRLHTMGKSMGAPLARVP